MLVKNKFETTNRYLISIYKLFDFSSLFSTVMAGKKRKLEDNGVNGASKRRAISDDEAHQRFRDGLFHDNVLERYTKEYAASHP